MAFTSKVKMYDLLLSMFGLPTGITGGVMYVT
jgi:hypothetical protein